LYNIVGILGDFWGFRGILGDFLGILGIRAIFKQSLRGHEAFDSFFIERVEGVIANFYTPQHVTNLFI
jgi:hypothetical protein